MQVEQNCLCQDRMVTGLMCGTLTVQGLVKEKKGTALMAYAFLAALVAVAAVTSFHSTGTAVTALYDMIATVVVASMPQ